jgi:PAS domain S-box-containing protein
MDDRDLKTQLEGLFSDLPESPATEETAPENVSEREERYRTLVENLAIGVFRSTPEPGRFVLANRAFLHLFGFDSPKDLEQIVPGDLFLNPEESETFFDRLLSMGSVTGMALPLKKNDGTPVLCSISATAVYGSEGQMAYFDCALEDISGRKWASAATDHWKHRYEQAAAFLGQVIYDCDIHTGSILWSHSIEQVFGYSLPEMDGGISQWAGLIHPEDQGTLVGALEGAEKTCSPYEVEYRFRHKNGQYIWIHERGFFIGDSAGKAAHRLGIMQKIVERQPSISSSFVILGSDSKDAEQVSEQEKTDTRPVPQAHSTGTGHANIAVPPMREDGLARAELPAAQTPAESTKPDDLYRRLTLFLKGRSRS